MEKLIEKLAALEHEQWVFWSKNISRTQDVRQNILARWQRLWVPYEQLPEKIKEEDRIWARKVIDLLKDGNDLSLKYSGHHDVEEFYKDE